MARTLHNSDSKEFQYFSAIVEIKLPLFNLVLLLMNMKYATTELLYSEKNNSSTDTSKVSFYNAWIINSESRIFTTNSIY